MNKLQAIIFRCRPGNQFRIGKINLEDSLEYIHSDTLFSAIVNTHSMLFEKRETDQFVDWLMGTNDHSMRMKFSSAFHCLEIQNGAYIFFLPKPVIYNLGGMLDPKLLKGIQFISASIWSRGIPIDKLLEYPVLGRKYVLDWEELANSELLDERSYNYLIRSFIKYSEEPMLGNFLRFRKINDKLLGQKSLAEKITYPKVNVRQIDQEGAYYTQTNIQLQAFRRKGRESAQSNFYFLVSLPDTKPAEKYQEQFLACLRLLVDEGIGGDRSTGTGFFDALEIVDDPFEIKEEAGYRATLSLTLPDAGEFQNFIFYQFILRGGGSLTARDSKLAGDHRKRVRMIREGAILPVSHDPQGTAIMLQPEGYQSPIIRYGKIFSLPFEIPDYEKYLF